MFEAGQLSGMKEINNLEQMKKAAKIIAGKGADHVFIKGGPKLPDTQNAIDLFYDGKEFSIIEEPLINTSWTHGAGCTTAAAIASGLARGLDAFDAVVLAKKFITKSLEGGFALNQWVGPGNPSAWRKKMLFE